MIRIDDHCIEDLDQMARDHYDFLNPIVTWTSNINGIPTQNSRLATHALISRIKRAKDASTRSANATEINFWNYFLNNHNANLKEVISGRPSILRAITHQLDAIFGTNFLATRQNYNTSKLTTFGIEVASVFNYQTLYRAKDRCVGNVRRFGLNCCPYCNAAPVEIIYFPIAGTPEEKRQALLELDHFYPQARFPYLALSFFNLIPGCSTCNARLKLEKDFDLTTHFNPFDKRLHDHFVFSIDHLKPKGSDDFTISAHSNTGHSNQALVDFRLLERYNQNHKHILFDTIDFMAHRRKGIVRSLVRQLPNLFGSFEQAEERVKKATGIPTNFREINQKPFAKLKLDICNQLGLI